ncbi:MAG: ABC transporter ATP-binding protein [Deltaproteobacteria bacterium]|nr:ABC transporter ATP-binding protein [Deltaproteobacteria bacterium]
MNEAAPILQATGLLRSFGTLQALRGLSLEIFPGEIYGLVGPDGAGKTTAIRILAGLMAPTRGEARIAGKDPLRDRAAVREMLGYMPQQYSLYGDLTIDENLSFFADMFCLSRKDYAPRRDRLLEITRLSRFRNRRADALSGGMYKKLALACSLLHRPRLLLLDEPTNGVDPVSRREFWDLLGEFTHEGMAVLISTPYMDEASRCHRVGLIHHGITLQDGAPSAMVRAFPHQVLRVSGGDRDAISASLSTLDGVLAVSPSGSRIRVVVERKAVPALAQMAAAANATYEAVAPDFEDLFLTRMREGES